jgi:hypothetical protein
VVAVTTTSRPRRSAGRAHHLSVVAGAAPRPRPATGAGPVLVGVGHDVARCGCHRRSALRTVERPGAGARSASAAIYRRRRLAALAVVVGLAFAAWTALGALGGVLTTPVRSVPPPGNGSTVVEVVPGDTLWSIARRLQPEGDPRPLVDRLAASHGGAAIRAGDRLLVS